MLGTGSCSNSVAAEATLLDTRGSIIDLRLIMWKIPVV
jgi:hypothetical protein